MDKPISTSNGFGFFRGRVALAAALRALGVGAGDRVAVQAYTCSALAEAILSLDAIPLWIDITRDGYTMDPVDLERKLVATPGVKAVVIQHTYGLLADMGRLVPIAANTTCPSSKTAAIHCSAHGTASRPVASVSPPFIRSRLESHW